MRKRNLLQAIGASVPPLVIAVFLTTCGEPFQPELADIKIDPETLLTMETGTTATLRVILVPSTGIFKIDGVPVEYSIKWEPGKFDSAKVWSFDDTFVKITQQDDFSAAIEAVSVGATTIRAWLVNKDDNTAYTNDHGNYTATCAVTIIK
ncbi:MAG: hypothetical protein LBU85_12105 [Treponema sp.]|jgi:hypothetical protein|nr:hypothetical protein [Treponema sp.]